MRTPMLVVVRVFLQHRVQMTFIDNEEMIETFLSDGAHPTFCISIGIWRSDRCTNHLNVLCSKDPVEGGREFGIVIMNEKSKRGCSLFDFPAKLARLLGDPSGSWMFGATRDVDAPSSQFDKEQDIDGFQPECFDGQKITRQHLLPIMTEKCLPTTFRLALGCRRNSKALE